MSENVRGEIQQAVYKDHAFAPQVQRYLGGTSLSCIGYKDMHLAWHA